ncbi:MAG: rhodanese-like domain-containing protein [Saprospiraceae bacterium]|nr:rhodanese-like domain-containing protein [Saprospiraceae bacterium]
MEINQASKEQNIQQDASCKTPRWLTLKNFLNNLKPKDFKESLQQAIQPILIDVRTAKEFEEYHFEDAINISYFAEDLWDQLNAFPKDSTFFVYCRTGRRSIRVCTLMRNGGFDNHRVYNLDGGVVAWKEVFG